MERAIVFMLGVVSLASASPQRLYYTHHPLCPQYFIVPTTREMRESFLTPEGFAHRCDEKSENFPSGEKLAWFRLQGTGGTGIINHKPERTGICGTKHPGWIQAKTFPTAFGISGGKLCYNKPPDRYTCPDNFACTDYRRIEIFNCAGEFFLYQIFPKTTKSENCAEAFCTGDVGPCELQTYKSIRTLPEMTLNYRMTSASGKKPRCDHEADYVNGKTWIRLKGEGGTEIIHEQPSSSGVCGTQNPGWITGSRPVQQGTAVQRELCYSLGSNGQCTDGRRIDLMNCWSFILYRLHNSSTGCSKAFCTHKPVYDLCDPKGYKNTTVKGDWSTRAYKHPRYSRQGDHEYADGKTWMQFHGGDGLKVITSVKQSQKNRCNVNNPGWMEGKIPKVVEGIARRKLCYYNGSATSCPNARDIDVVNCGTFLLYRFHKVSLPTKSAFCIDLFTHGPCYYQPCFHGSTCVEKDNCYKCNCPKGVSGRNCETDDTNECNSQPCRNGGTCYDDFGKYRCVCKPGFTGLNCDIEVDKCTPNPCRNGGTCAKNGDSYECQCPTGYTGDNCETTVTDTDDCSPNPCKNFGICTDGVNTFTCQCLFMMKGKTCEDDSDVRGIISLIGGYYDDDDDGCSGFFCWLKNLFKSVFNGLVGLLGGLINFIKIPNLSNFLNNLNNNLNNNGNNPSNPNDRCALANLGSALNGLRQGNNKCKLKYDNKKCTIREKAKPKKQKPEPPTEAPTEEQTEAPEETTTTKEPSSCTATCSAVQNPDHGARIGDKTNCGDSVSFSCDQGYKLQGCAEPQCKITCKHDGQWSNQPPKCVKTTCGNLVTLSASKPQQKVEKTVSSDHTDCNWAVTSEKPAEILLRFSVFQLPNSISRQRKCRDYVEIVVGTRRDRFCGDKPDNVISIINAGMIRFHASSSQAQFKVELSLQIGCGSSLDPLRRRALACKPCHVSSRDARKWPPHMHVPVMTNVVDESLKLPNIYGVLKFVHGEKVTARCTGSKFEKFSKDDKVTLECENGKFKVTHTDTGDGHTTTTNKQTFENLKCLALPKPVLWQDAISKKIHIGWEKDRLTQIVISYDNTKRVPNYAEHTVRSTVVWVEGETNEKSGKKARPNFKNSKLHGIAEVKPNDYEKKLQYERLEKLQPGLGNKYIDCCDANFLVRGHLAPNADFSYHSWRGATFYMVNVAPQWQVINAGNWLVLEDEVRNYAYQRQTDIKVISGTYGQLELDGYPIDFPEPGTPVPSHFWKVIHDKSLNAAAAFVVLNNPYAKTDADNLPLGKDKLCPRQCDFLKTSTKQTALRGITMCCSPDDLRKIVTFLPVLTAPVTELFKSDNTEAIAFGQRLERRLS